MGNGGFWIFVVIVVANLVITAIKKSAEKKAAAKAAVGTTQGKPAPSGRRILSGNGDLEVILERVGDRSFDVMTVLRETAGLSLDAASEACVSPPAVVGTRLTRSEAGAIRQGLEGVGAGASIRRMERSSFQTAATQPARAVEKSIGSVGRSLERVMRSVEQSIERGVGPASRAPKRASTATRQGQASSRVEVLRTPPSARPSKPNSTPRVDPPRRPPSTEPSAPTVALIQPLPEVGGFASRSRQGSAAAGRVRDMLGRREALRDAFVLQELLRPPLCERPGASGGRQG